MYYKLFATGSDTKTADTVSATILAVSLFAPAGTWFAVHHAVPSRPSVSVDACRPRKRSSPSQSYFKHSLFEQHAVCICKHVHAHAPAGKVSAMMNVDLVVMLKSMAHHLAGCLYRTAVWASPCVAINGHLLLAPGGKNHRTLLLTPVLVSV